MAITIYQNYLKLLIKYYEWRSKIEIWEKLIFSFIGAFLIGITAQIKINLPWTPVPIVGSTFGVVLTSVLLGRNWGAISTIIYVLLGSIGIPWFAGFTGGLNIIIGPTGGYLLGFILASYFIGYVIDKFPKSRNFIPLTLIMIISHLILIYIPGLIQLSLWYVLAMGKEFDFVKILWMGAIPFIPGDIIKSIFAALAVYFITPKEKDIKI